MVMRIHQGRVYFPIVVVFKLVFFMLVLGESNAFAQDVSQSRDELTEIVNSVRRLGQPQLINGIPDYTAPAVQRQRKGLNQLRSQFDSIDPSSWQLEDQVDYLIVRSELDMLDYGLNVYRATSRSPNFYLSSISSSKCPSL